MLLYTLPAKQVAIPLVECIVEVHHDQSRPAQFFRGTPILGLKLANFHGPRKLQGFRCTKPTDADEEGMGIGASRGLFDCIGAKL